MNTVMLSTCADLRTIQAGQLASAEAQELHRKNVSFLDQVCHPALPPLGTMALMRAGIEYLRGAFAVEGFSAQAAEAAMSQRDLEIALYRDLLVGWTGLTVAVTGEKPRRGDFTDFEARLLQGLKRSESSPPNDPPSYSGYYHGFLQDSQLAGKKVLAYDTIVR